MRIDIITISSAQCWLAWRTNAGAFLTLMIQRQAQTL